MKTILGVYCKKYPDKTYLYEKDIDTLSKLKEWMNLLNILYLTDSGLQYIKSHFSKNELLEVATENSCSYVERFLDYPESYVTADIDKVIIWNDNDVLKTLSGIPDKKLPVNYRIIFVGPKLPFQANDFKHYLNLIKENYNKNKGRFDSNLFNLIWNNDDGVEKFFDVNLNNTNYYGYSLIDIYYNLVDDEKTMDARIKIAEKELDLYIKEQNLPLYEKTIPLSRMRVILWRLNRNPQNEDEHKKSYVVFLDKLASIHDRLALKIKAYAYYDGNNYVKQDYKVSEQCLLELLGYSFDDAYANTLGNIYYYGKVNDGIPQYDKAFKYFTMASSVGNVESTYKLGEMYKNGYGVAQNEEVCKQCNESLYPRVMKEFQYDPISSCLADVALRLGSFYTDKESAHKGARLFLEALLAINMRYSRFDSSEKKSILNSLFNIYNEHKQEILSHNNIKYSLMHFEEFTLTREGNDLLIESKEERLVFDLEMQNAAFVSSVHVIFKGEVLMDIQKEDNICDEIVIEENGNIFFKYHKRIIFIIGNGKTRIEFKRPLLKRQEDENIYHVANCQYTKGKGRTYTYLIEEDGDISNDWIIMENQRDIYPLEFKYVKGYELPSEVTNLKHIVIKR